MLCLYIYKYNVKNDRLNAVQTPSCDTEAYAF